MYSTRKCSLPFFSSGDFLSLSNMCVHTNTHKTHTHIYMYVYKVHTVYVKQLYNSSTRPRRQRRKETKNVSLSHSCHFFLMLPSSFGFFFSFRRVGFRLKVVVIWCFFSLFPIYKQSDAKTSGPTTKGDRFHSTASLVVDVMREIKP